MIFNVILCKVSYANTMFEDQVYDKLQELFPDCNITRLMPPISQELIDAVKNGNIDEKDIYLCSGMLEDLPVECDLVISGKNGIGFYNYLQVLNGNELEIALQATLFPTPEQRQCIYCGKIRDRISTNFICARCGRSRCPDHEMRCNCN